MNDNFKCMYKILKTLEKALDYTKYDFEIINYENLGMSKERWNAYIEMLNESGYLKGVKVKEYTDGEKLIDISEMRITLKGLEYLTENSHMQRIHNLVK